MKSPAGELWTLSTNFITLKLFYLLFSVLLLLTGIFFDTFLQRRLFSSGVNLANRFLIVSNYHLIGLLSIFTGNYSEVLSFTIYEALTEPQAPNPASIYLLKVDKRKARKRCEICSKLTIKTPERRHWGHSGVFIGNFEHISHLVLVFLLLTLSR